MEEPVVNAVRQADEAEFLRVEEQQVRRQPPDVLRQQRDLEQQLRLGLAARQLHRGHRLVRDLEAQAPRAWPRGSMSRFGVP